MSLKEFKMAEYISITAIGKDKPGIVSAITEVLTELKCNIEDSTMTILHGQFAMILIIRLSKGLSHKIILSKLNKPAKSLGMSLTVSQLCSFSKKKKSKSNPYVISIYGKDKTGIVYGASSFLASKKINITDVQTTVSKKTYIMLIEAELPKNISAKELEKELSCLAKSLNVSVSLNRAESSDI
jgi:glycine cleavage system transcriptional repressor